MKRVRFESPVKTLPRLAMEPDECHSPRPFINKKIDSSPTIVPYTYSRIVQPNYSDPVDRYDSANSSPFPLPNKANFEPYARVEPRACAPSSDLELSMLESLERNSVFNDENIHRHLYQGANGFQSPERNFKPVYKPVPPQVVLSPLDNGRRNTVPNILRKDDGFFIRPEKSSLTSNQDLFTLPLSKVRQYNEGPLKSKQNIIKTQMFKSVPVQVDSNKNLGQFCMCHHCGNKNKENSAPCLNPHGVPPHAYHKVCTCLEKPYYTVPVNPHCDLVNQNCCQIPVKTPSCNSHENCSPKPASPKPSPKPKNAVDKKAWMIEKYEKPKQAKSIEIDKEKALEIKKATEPDASVSDLIKIIKLQNEQLQLLQEKVDKFISIQNSAPIENYKTEHVAIQSNDSHHKISIGVMTSFEMVRASTFINKQQNAKQSTSQINIKEIFSAPQQRFLDGIEPVRTNLYTEKNKANFEDNRQRNNENDKTVNDLSLCNLKIDNAITPQLSPDQTLYLDVKDFSDSDDDNGTVGWTYYNKVMTQVNGILEESDMASSAGAMYRNRGRCVQMQIDKSNISITKRVTFGDEPLRTPIHIPPSTDTSMKMDQLAAKYLAHTPPTQQPATKPYSTVDMSFATRNYMERHQIIRSGNVPLARATNMDIPKFLDITALKQQPKLL